MRLGQGAVVVVTAALASGVVLAQRRPVRPATAPVASAVDTNAATPQGLTLRLSEGGEESSAPAPAPTHAASRPLNDGETRALLERLPPLSAAPADAQPFALREKSLPPPRTGATIAGVFPAPDASPVPAARAAGPLQVVRRAPSGDVPLAPSLSVTFSEPMVAVTSHDDLARESVPLRLDPEPPGRWRWVGTKTLLFEPTGRFPMATEYRVEVPAGTRAASGATLAAAERWTFTTATPTLLTSHPAGGPSRRDTLLFAGFDQKIDPAAVLATIHATSGSAAISLRLASAEEVRADEDVRRLSEAAEKDRWLAFRAVSPLPADSAVTVTIGPGTPSAEGRRTTAKPQAFTFRTFGALRVTEHRCGWDGSCPPMAPWSVVFSNPIDARRFRKDLVTVEPALPGLKVDVNGQWMNIRGASKGRTTYRVTLSPEIADVFGQGLGGDTALTFTVGPAVATLRAPGGERVVLDPAGGPRFSVYTVNQPALKVRAYAVTPTDWPAFHPYLQKTGNDEAALPPGRLAFSKTVPVASNPDELTETAIDLSPALEGGLGHVVLIVEPTVQPKERWQRNTVRVWVEATQIGLAAFSDAAELVAWASSLKDGRPLADVEVTLLPAGNTARTRADGLATLTLPGTAATVLVARSGRDTALLPPSSGWWYQNDTWKRRDVVDGLRFFVFDDRHLYRPGEEVHVKGWIRRVGNDEGGDVAALGGAVKTLRYALRDAQGNEVLKGERDVNAMGAFDVALKLPATMNLGHAFLMLETSAAGLAGTKTQHDLEVQEFRRPEFEVTATADAGPHFVGASASVAVRASYFAGGALPGADLVWNVTSTPSEFTPPNRDDFTFGIWVPWWESHGYAPIASTESQTKTLAGRTDAAGRHRLQVAFERVEPPRATTVKAEATVTDVNRQAWTASTSLLVHAADVYVGLKSERMFVQKGEPLRFDAVAVDVAGAAVPRRPIEVRAERLDWEQEAGEWKEKAADPQTCAVTSAADAVHCTFETKEGGTYRITAVVTDTQGRRNQTEVRRWVAGGKMPPRREVEQEAVTLIPSRKDFRAGDTAEILVLSPFSPAEGVLTLRRSGIFRTERFSMTGASHTLRLKLEEAWTPNVHIQIDLVGASARTSDGAPAAKLPPRPAFAKGELNLELPPVARTLGVKVAAQQAALEPGGRTTIDVDVTDAAGKAAAGSEVAVVVVDEAVLSLTGYRIADPLSVFYAQREPGGSDAHLRADVLLSRPEDLELAIAEEPMLRRGEVQAMGYLMDSAVAGGAPAAAPAPQGFALASRAKGGGGPAAAPAPIRARTDFNATALFVASATTDASGKAHLPMTLPDNLTRYRITAVAVTEGHDFGKGESTLVARLPLMLRPSPPRFLNFGDRIELPVVVQNQTDAPLEVDVALRATNARLPDPRGQRVTVPANDRAEVRFAVDAAAAGTARFQAGAASGRWADAATFELPVWTPATTEAFATYGQIDDEKPLVQPVKAPTGVVPQFGGLEVTTSSTAVQALTDAVMYLVSYPFECAEQISSRVLGIAALKDVLTAFDAEGLPKPEEMVARVDADVKRLALLQNDDGGFAFWHRGDESWPYVSIHVAHALQRAKEKGFAVPPAVLERARGYLRDIDRHVADKKYGADTRRTLVAYALNVRERMGDRDAARARKLVHEEGLSGLTFEAIGWALPVLSGDASSAAEVAEIRRHLANHATETAATAHFAVSYGDGAHLILHSDRRADAVLLEALIRDQPKNDLIPKLVEGLLGHRRKGRWENTQENVFVLLALERYFGTYEKITPNFVARAWLGADYAGEHAFRGRTTERHAVNVPMKLLADGPAQKDLVLAKEGPGRLYYRIGLQYAPASLSLAPMDQGFTVERTYEGVDGPQDVTRAADGTWHVKAGARVRVKLTMVAPSRRYHVALVDPLPAGLEALNPALATTGAIPAGSSDETVSVFGAPGLGGPRGAGSWWWWRGLWYEHQNLRDERVEAFTSLLWEGVYSYSYVARATTPGRFVVPPPRAEEMYHPETFGRGATDRLVVD
jgi:uncharacterized protein YfaS (alpha-2-macroglobulin family)